MRAMDSAPPLPPSPSWRELIRLSLPVTIAISAFAITVGVLARTGGFGWVAPTVFSGTTWAGASQVAALSVLTGGGGVAAAIVAGALVNLRYFPIGISVASSLRGSPLRRFLEAQLVADVNWALAHRGGGHYDRRILLGAGVLMWFVWVGGTLVGLLIGGVVRDPRTYGLDAVFPALFVGLLVPQVRSRRPIAATALAAGLILVAVPFVPPGIPVVIGAGAMLLGWRRSR